MYSVVGFRNKTFNFDDGKFVSGFELHVTEENSVVTGVAVDRFFVSMNKLTDGVVPSVGDVVDIRFNRFGKVQSCTVMK